MTTTFKDITEYLDVKGIDYNPIRLSTLLSKLDWEQLEDLLYTLKDVFAAGTEEMSSYAQGYSEGYDDGYSEGYDDSYDKGYDDGYDKGYDDGTSTEE